MAEGILQNDQAEKRLDAIEAELREIRCNCPERRTVDLISDSILTTSQQQRLKFKIDLRVIAFLSIIFGMSIVDRINIGSAKVLGMQQDVGINNGARYSICLLLFFPGYILAAIPSNMLLVKVGVKKWISVATVLFGVCVLGIGFAPNYQVIAFLRFFLGFFEGGIMPGLLYLVSSWYPRYELHRRVVLGYGTGTLAAAFAGLFAYGIGKMSGIRGMLGWRWIFIIEGTFTMLLGLLAPFFLTDFPDRVTFLKPDEREWVLARLLETGSETTEKFTFETFIENSHNPWNYVVSLMFLCVMVATNGLAYFIPTILTGLGYKGLQAALYSVPPWAAACGMLALTSIVGDKLRTKGPLIIIMAAMTIAGIALVQPTHNVHVRFGGLFLALMGIQANQMTVLAYAQNNIVGSSKRGTMAVWNMVGSSIGGIIGTTIFRSQDAPTYGPGLYTLLALQALLIIITVVVMGVFHRKNKKADSTEAILHGIRGWRYTL